jgi:glycosyltransferase involved in cell wall biosynthesis
MIDILLATFNGGKFIENQLLSIISQTHKDWRLIIHDDGSSDDTLLILKKYQKIDSRIFIVDDDIICRSASKNFLHLLSYSASAHIIFCDQDDIWLESKLQILFDSIKTIDGPAAVYCNAFGYNGVGITKAKVSLFERDSLENSLFLNSGIQGCSLMFNKALLDMLLDFPSFIVMHDHYITMGAVSFAKLKYVDLSLMLYRQHDGNVTGNIALSLSDRIHNFFNRDNAILDRKHYEANKSFYIKFEDKFTAHQKEIFQVYLQFPQMNFVKKIYVLLKYNFSIGNNKMILLLKLLFKNTI